jgi:hypothetical protein
MSYLKKQDQRALSREQSGESLNDIFEIERHHWPEEKNPVDDLKSIGEEIALETRRLVEAGKATSDELRTLRSDFLQKYVLPSQYGDVSHKDLNYMLLIYTENQQLLDPFLTVQSEIHDPALEEYYGPTVREDQMAAEIYHAIYRYLRAKCAEAIDSPGEMRVSVKFRPDGYEVLGASSVLVSEIP